MQVPLPSCLREPAADGPEQRLGALLCREATRCFGLLLPCGAGPPCGLEAQGGGRGSKLGFEQQQTIKFCALSRALGLRWEAAAHLLKAFPAHTAHWRQAWGGRREGQEEHSLCCSQVSHRTGAAVGRKADWFGQGTCFTAVPHLIQCGKHSVFCEGRKGGNGSLF